jgi:hypothetical protein
LPQVRGRLRYFACAWQKLTRDQCILDIVSHCHIEFSQNPNQTDPPRSLFFNSCKHVPGEYISPIFSRPKKNVSVRIILNLKELNDSVQYHHFKMDNRQMAARLMTKGCHMTSIDIMHAYYMVRVAKAHRKYICFLWGGGLPLSVYGAS